MANPWLFIIGIHPSGLDGLSAAARRDLDDASIVFGSPRHLALADVPLGERGRAWPVPFDVAPALALRGQARVAVLVSGDPFHFGGGASLARCLDVGEWKNHPQPSTFSWIAGELGWSLEDTQCLGLHARPFDTLTPLLAVGQRFVCLVRDGAAGQCLAVWLSEQGWGESPMWLVSHAGGDLQSICSGTARELSTTVSVLEAPLTCAFEARGGDGFTRVPGRSIDTFAHDGQITKSPVRAMTLAALAPRRGECLWDLGAGSGSVAIEWCLAGGRAVCVEQHAERVANIEQNARRYAAALRVVQGDSRPMLAQLQPEPQAVFVGGGFNRDLFDALRARLQGPWRLVVNAVALETQALLMELHRVHGGQLLQLQWSEATPLGGMQAWQAARPLVQWIWNAP
ncbi:precorrin-6Y C5,15-methyltransferase (decarboxylating) subunit CbiT [Diaphorobacter sp. HDW4A]|uniref:precorrin-6Y C5,15-methyltransferase (decarboxylating) subunit CbiT n=1 Tax=Diaphorobacter sp. HDW4A TaxID=2714924 RepID=UPI001409E864|nr:precorrin-6Y C5,15-methyltransferase (decarboxylating) subunit CbiT [Diaphorobacter sp. HDW4A]QIL79241.1 precorrin-6Y C5,15-methyltransferase (decarboxylating) subunit CbiT [Diaphorobacter sp. HDW4A]